MPEVVFKFTLFTLLGLGVVGAVIMVPVIVVSVTNTRLGMILLNTRGGKGLLRSQVVKYLARWLGNKPLWHRVIDADFARMVNAPDYQATILEINREFASSDWEAFQLGENRQ